MGIFFIWLSLHYSHFNVRRHNQTIHLSHELIIINTTKNGAGNAFNKDFVREKLVSTGIRTRDLPNDCGLHCCRSFFKGLGLALIGPFKLPVPEKAALQRAHASNLDQDPKVPRAYTSIKSRHTHGFTYSPVLLKPHI